MEIELGNKKSDNSEVSIDVKELIDTGMAIIGQRRSGKTYATAKICEELAEVGQQFVCIDVMGNFYSLKERYNVLVVSMRNPPYTDVSDVDVDDAPNLAEAIYSSGQSVIIDLKLGTMLEQYKFLASFLETFYMVGRESENPIVLVVDEIHRLAPESSMIKLKEVSKYQKEVIYWLSELSRTGGNFGIGYLVAGQREAETSKTTLTQCGIFLYFRLRGVDFTNFAKKVSSDVAEQAKSIGQGEAVVTGLELDDFIVEIGERRTTHQGATPDLKPIEPKSIQEFQTLFQTTKKEEKEEEGSEAVEELKSSVEKHKNKIKELSAKIKELKERIEELEEEIKRKDNEIKKWKDKHNQLSTDMESYVEHRDQLLEKINSLTKEKNWLETKNAELEQQLSEASNVEKQIISIQEFVQTMFDSLVDIDNNLELGVVPQDVSNLKQRLDEVEDELQRYKNTEKELEARKQETINDPKIQQEIKSIKHTLNKELNRSGTLPDVIKKVVTFSPEIPFYPQDIDVGVTPGTVSQHLRDLHQHGLIDKTEVNYKGKIVYGYKNNLHLLVTKKIRRIKPSAPDEAITQIVDDITNYILHRK